MRKSKILIVMGLCTMLLATGCGKKETAANTYSEYVKLGEYKGIEVVPESTEVTNDEVDAKINETLQNASTQEEVKDRAVKDGDIVNIDYVGKIDGKEFEGGSKEGHDLTIGSKSFIDGFEDQLIGANIGDTVEVKVTFPETYENNPDLAGKDAVFTVKINKITETVVPTLTKEWVKKNSEAKTVEEYKDSVRTELETKKTEDAATKKTADVLTTIVENSEIKGYPQDEIDEYVNSMVDYYKAYAQQYGIDYETFLSSFLQKTEKEFKEEAKTMAKATISRQMVCYMIADKEGMTVSDEEYKEGLDKFVEEYSAESAEAFEEKYGKEVVKQNILLEKVLAFVTDNAVEVESIKEANK